MARLSAIALDPGKFETGFPYKWKGVTWYLRPIDGPDVQARTAELIAESDCDEAKLEDFPEDEQRRILATVLSELVLVHWEDLEDDGDQAIPYSREKAFEILSSKYHPDLIGRFSAASAQRDNYRLELVNGVVGN